MMRKIDYYVATSVDGFICGPEEDISGFDLQSDSEGVQRYLADLEKYDTVIMGRTTYEFGYKFGLKPGDLAYPHMQHYIFSNTLQLPSHSPNLRVCNLDLEVIDALKAGDGDDIYLCGGGVFAGWLLDAEKIDRLIVKLNPFVQGSGTRLFETHSKIVELLLVENRVYEGGLMTNTYQINYPEE